MKDITVVSKTIPANPRSDNYQSGSTVVRTSGGTTVIAPGGGDSVDILKENDNRSLTDKMVMSALRSVAEFISKKNDSSVKAVVDYLNGIKIGGTSLTKIIQKSTQVDAYSDSDVMSALRVMDEILNNNEKLKELFLSRQNDDEASGLIKFLQGIISLGDIVAKSGITVGENGHGITVGNSGIVTAILDELKNIFNIVSPDFVSGDLGNGFILKYDPETGRSHLEVDDLLVRKIAYFVELVIKQLRHVGGEIILTPASMKCNKVEVLADVYRCYFKQDDGDRSIVQEFVAGDRARCQTFNIKEGTSHNVKNQYYWRLVTAVGDDYIDLSKTDCDTGSGIPTAGDDIVQLGNRNEVKRQNAIILSTIGDDAPSFKQYKGINSYTMKGKEVTILSATLNKLIGQFISETTGKSYDTMFEEIQANVDIIKEQTDKEYTLWFFEYIPTLNNIPASDWNTSELKTMHEQDMFYNRASGLAYRFEKSGETWTWNNITDQQTIKALENAAKAQDTADGKRRVFVAQPTNAQAYDIGDLWTNATYGELYTNDTLVCKTPKTSGIAFSIDHWKPINTATTAYIENLGDRITLAVTDSNEGIEAAKKLANQGISDAGTAYNKAVAAASAAAGAQGGVNDLNTVVAEHTTVIQQTKDSITALAGKISFDASGKVTNISTSGLVTTADFNTLLSKKVSFDASGKITNISTSGLVTEAAFAGLFSSRVTDEGLVKRADISTFITSDEAGNLISKATIRADQINLTGKLTISMLATDLKSCIDGKADAGDLGGLAYKDAVEKAMLGSTLISGAYLKTELIDVDSLYVKHLKGATGDFTGTLSGVQGTFQSLSSPGGETTMTFANVYNGMLISGDIHHHEHVSFYGKAIFADMSLGYRALAYVKVTGNKAEYYSHGAYTYPVKSVKTLTLRSISMGNYTWYDIPLTPNGAYDDCYNVVYLCNSSGYRYIFSENYAGNVFYLVNTNNNIANIYYCNSGAVNISGGQVHTLMKAPREYLNPAVGTVYGAGLICVSTFDNNW